VYYRECGARERKEKLWHALLFEAAWSNKSSNLIKGSIYSGQWEYSLSSLGASMDFVCIPTGVQTLF
jgi:hypothetical protein